MDQYTQDKFNEELSIIGEFLADHLHDKTATLQPNVSTNVFSPTTLGRSVSDWTYLHSDEHKSPDSVSTSAFANNAVESNQIGTSITTSREDGRSTRRMNSNTLSDTITSEPWRAVMEPSLIYPNNSQPHSISHWGRNRGLHFSAVVEYTEPMSPFVSKSYGNTNFSLPYEPVQHRPHQIIETGMYPSIPHQNSYNWRLNSMDESTRRDYSNTTQPSLSSDSQANSSRSKTSDEFRQPQNEQESSRTSFSSVNMFSEVQESSVSIINSVNKLNTNITGRFACSLCGKEFTSERLLKVHQHYAHDQKGPFECNICQKKITGKERFNLHVKYHFTRGLYVCRTCGRHYRLKGSLTKHERTHTSEESLECGGCGAIFIDGNCLVAHKNTQTRGEPFKCPKCGEEFVLKCALEAHIRHHPGEGPHQCRICNAKFWKKKSLYSHQMKKHPSERPLKCRFCCKRFRNQCHLKVHQVRVHDATYIK